MKKDQHIGFINPPTYMFIRWVQDGGAHDPKKLVDSAMEAVENEKFFETDGDVSSAARNQLATMLDTIVDELRDEDWCGEADELYGDHWEFPESEPEWLTRALLADALEQIDCHVAALVLMLEAGKWNPDVSAPEIGDPEDT